MSHATQIHGTAADGTALTVVYAEQPADRVAFALAFPGSDLPRLVHWGRPVAHPDSLLGAYDALKPQRVSGALDETAWPSVLPTQAESWIGEPRLVLRRGGVELFPKFVVTGIEAADDAGVVGATVDATPSPEWVDAARAFGRGALAGDDAAMAAASDAAVHAVAAAATQPGVTPADPDDPTGPLAYEDVAGQARTAGPVRVPGVRVTACDEALGVEIEWRMEIVSGGLLRQQAEVRNLFGADQPGLEVGKVELGFALPAAAAEILTTTGHHLRERSPQRQPLTVGRFARPQLAGRPDFDATLLTTVGVPGFGFEHGEAWALHVAWSGNAVSAVERLPYTQAQLTGGELLFGGEVTLGPAGGAGETADGDATAAASYRTPWVYGSYGDGLNEIAARFHTYLRSRHPRLVAKPRPVILNTWEAVYFQHDFDTLKALADKAAASGVERFVVDDGWFGARRDDTKGLGDWQISPEVWPDGPKSLKALADYVHGLGMEFGLWFEPEMTNPDSELARNHPDWILAPVPGRLPMQGRSQQVVDLTNPEAFDYIAHAMDALVGELGIDYIKWDHNKLVTEAVSPKTGRPAVHAQTEAVYRIFRTLKTRHPGLEIESCSSGGGRVDLGILEYADRIWVSDCVDPVERADIQRYTSLLVPPFMMGEHVGASPAHSTRRATSQELRMAMAFFGHMGIEWDLNHEPQEALDKLGRWVGEYKKHRDWFAVDTCVHGDTPDPAVRLDGMVKPERDAAIYRFTQLTTSQTYPAAPVRLPGLDPDRLYRVSPLAPSLDLEGLGNGQSPLGWWTEDGVVLPGAALIAYGIRPPSLHPAQAVLLKVVAE
ncbi:alpha-galactosidase [Bifidobacterium pullorum subsp. saeculare]|uniref:alpha-galactosidase n=1 Tax=Bifidobacterium pullorum subsp. saeculare TaxID=78257 RepID=A0A938WXP5_9BIFI|nr:alpha-galactosidase [Bifidobacterium pullorum]MBM6699523.1 alpha-galactosidase [Bifidobacterium pullorum subsp. saeculare]